MNLDILLSSYAELTLEGDTEVHVTGAGTSARARSQHADSPVAGYYMPDFFDGPGGEDDDDEEEEDESEDEEGEEGDGEDAPPNNFFAFIHELLQQQIAQVNEPGELEEGEEESEAEEEG